MMWTKEPVTYFDLKKEAICFALDGLLVTYFDPKRPQATCFVPEDHQLTCFEIGKHRDTYSVPVEHHLIFLDREKPQAIYSDPGEHQAICSDQKSPTESKAEVTCSVLRSHQDTYFDQGVVRDTFFDQGVVQDTFFDRDVRNKQVLVSYYAYLNRFCVITDYRYIN